MKMRAFWDIVPFSLVGVDRHFIGMYCLHHQGDDYATCGRFVGYIGIGRTKYISSKPSAHDLFIILMTEAVPTSETSVSFKKTI
jgi:hypothetical protein